MRFIQTTCKLCKGPAIARFDENAPQDAVDKFLPMLTHDHCYDLILKRNQSGAMILDTCFEYGRTPSGSKGKIVVETRQALIAATRAYAEAIAGLLHAPHVIWSEDFADILLEKPVDCRRILKEYRDEVRRSAHQPATEAA